MSLELSRKVTMINPSATFKMVSRIAELKNQNIDVIGFNIGEPDFDTPDHINEAIIKAIQSGQTRYVNASGILELRIAISEKLRTENNLNYQPDQIVVSTGAKQALYNTIMTLANDGDEIIIPTPCWVSYEEMVKVSGATCVFVPTEATTFQLDPQAIEKAITSKTKAIIINTPNNPTGCVYSKEVLEKLAALAIKYDFYVICDEIYEKLIYDGQQHFSLASFNEEIYRRAITINGFAKSHAMTGYRIGYAVYPPGLADKASNLQVHSTSNSTTPVQYGALAALQANQEKVEEMVAEFAKRRELSMELLSEIENIKFGLVSGAFYLMIDVSSFYGKSYNNYQIKDAEDMTLYLLEEARIALVAGTSFQAPNYLRFTYANSQANIREGISRMKMALAKLK